MFSAGIRAIKLSLLFVLVYDEDFDEYDYPATPYSKAVKTESEEKSKTGEISTFKNLRNPAIPLSLNNCIKVALKNNEGVILAGKGVELAKVQLWIADFAWLPRFSISGEVSYRNNEPETEFTIPSMPPMRTTMEDRSKAGGVAEAMFPIWLFGRIANSIDMRSAQVDKARADSRRTKQQITYIVTQAYTGILELKHTIETLKSSIKLLNELLTNAKNFLEQGLITKNEVLTLEVTLASREQALIEVESGLKQATYRLNSLLNLDITRKTIVNELSELPTFKLPEIALVNLALGYRPEVYKAEAEKEMSEAQLRLSKNNIWPMIYGYVNVTATSASTLINPIWLTFGVRFQWNVFDSGESIGNIKSAKIAKEMQEVKNRMLYKEISIETRTAFEKLKIAEKKIIVTQKQIRLAEENLDILKAKFEEAIVTSAEILEGETLLINAKSDYWSAVYGLQKAWAQLEFATGLKFDPDYVSKIQNIPAKLNESPEKKINEMKVKPHLEKTKKINNLKDAKKKEKEPDKRKVKPVEPLGFNDE